MIANFISQCANIQAASYYCARCAMVHVSALQLHYICYVHLQGQSQEANQGSDNRVMPLSMLATALT